MGVLPSPEPHPQPTGVTGRGPSWRQRSLIGCFPGWNGQSRGASGSCCGFGPEPRRGVGRGENTRSETRRPTDGGAEDVRDTDRQKGTQSQEEENQAVEDGWKAGSHAEPRAEQQASRWTSQ